jgi:hypothetical protein
MSWPFVCFVSADEGTCAGSSGGWRLLLRVATDRAEGVSLFLDRVVSSGAGSGVAFLTALAAFVAAAPQSCCRAAKALIASLSQPHCPK